MMYPPVNARTRIDLKIRGLPSRSIKSEIPKLFSASTVKYFSGTEAFGINSDETRRQLHVSTTLGTARHDGGAQRTTTKQELVLNTEMLSNEALRKIQTLGDQHSHPR